jgi:hypothetical protein
MGSTVATGCDIDMMHIIVQAGGRGSRLRHHTWNKPKCLVSIKGRPLLYHLFDRFPDANFHIIGDYAYEQLEKYLEVNDPAVTYTLTRARGKGTASGILDVLKTVPEHSELMITWSDLIIGKLPDWPCVDVPVVALTNAFTCRWTQQDDGTLKEIPGPNGIPGIFYVRQAKNFPEPPSEGEFVKWFSRNVPAFTTVMCNDLEELGDFSSIEQSNDSAGFARFFNQVDIGDVRVEKSARVEEYQHLIDKEKTWYHDAELLGFRRIPKVYSQTPFCMQRIMGQHAYALNDLSTREKRSVLADYLDSLQDLHHLGDKPAIEQELWQVYIEKTRQRVHTVSSLIPGFENPSMTVNGVKCQNVFCGNKLEDLFPHITTNRFTPIHGDPTFSNSLIDHNLKAWFIDPRGYFYQPGIWGDPWYDFAKVYYSAQGGYDAFNRRKFKLHVDDETVEILQDKPLFADVADSVFEEFFGNDLRRIQILHGLIWLSFSGYVKDDIDSVIGSFYLGLYWLEKAAK